MLQKTVGNQIQVRGLNVYVMKIENTAVKMFRNTEMKFFEAKKMK